MASNGEDHYWLKINPVQHSKNAVTIPKPVIQLDLVKTERPGYWGHDPETRRVLITHNIESLNEHYAYNSYNKVGKNRVCQIPTMFMMDEDETSDTGELEAAKAETGEEREGAVAFGGGEDAPNGEETAKRDLPVDLSFRNGETLHFVTTLPTLAPKDLCYVLKDEEARAMLDEKMIDKLTDGGRSPRRDDYNLRTDGGDRQRNILDEAEDIELAHTMPEAFVNEGEVLHIETGDIIEVDVLQERIDAAKSDAEINNGNDG